MSIKNNSFQYYNPHPSGRKTDDCVIRALTIAVGKTWKEVYKELLKTSWILCDMPNSQIVYENFLKEHGFERHTVKVVKGEKRTTVRDMTNEDAAIIICRVAHHLVTIKNHIIYDTWDSSNKSVYSYYIKSEIKGGKS